MVNPFAKLPTGTTPAAAKPARKTLTTKPGANAKPSQEQAANAGAMPNLMGDATKAKLAARPTIRPSAAPAAAAPSANSGIDQAMGDLANKLHPTRG